MSRVSGDGGASLVELLVTIMLVGIIGSVITTVIVTGTHDEVRVTAHSAEMVKVRTSLDRVMREIRDAHDVAAMTQTSITVRQQHGTGWKYLSYSLVANGAYSSLVRSAQYRNASDVVTGNDPQTTLINHLVNTAAQAVFTPTHWTDYTSANAASNVNATTCAITGVTPTTYAPECVGSVTFHLLDAVPTTNEVLEVTDDVSLRNTP